MDSFQNKQAGLPSAYPRVYGVLTDIQSGSPKSAVDYTTSD